MSKILLLVLALLLLLTVTSCQQAKKGSYPSGSSTSDGSCTDTNGNGICDNKDTDNDGLLDEKENELGTDPTSVDSDGDGASDLCEFQNGTDPKSSDEKPDVCTTTNPPIVDPSDPNLKAACILLEEQKRQKEWFDKQLYNKKDCELHELEDENGKKTGETEEICTVNSSSTSNGIGAENYGVIEEAEKKVLSIKVKWGVSYKDVLMISNGVLSVRPWFVFFNYLWGSSTDDDRQWDHHLGDLPSTSSSCEDSVLNKAVVTIDGQDYEWQHPAFMPFKIPQIENVYPFSSDGIAMVGDKDGDKIEYMGSPNNNFSYRTHLVSVQVESDYRGQPDETFWGKQYSGGCGGVACKYKNNLCETREIEFKYEFFKTIPTDEEAFEFNYKDLEEQCKGVLDSEVAQ